MPRCHDSNLRFSVQRSSCALAAASKMRRHRYNELATCKTLAMQKPLACPLRPTLAAQSCVSTRQLGVTATGARHRYQTTRNAKGQPRCWPR